MAALWPTPPASHARRHSYDLPVFFALVLALTWVVWVPRALGVPVGLVGRLWTWIPALVALAWAALVWGRAGVRDLGRRLLRWRVAWWWYVVLLVAPLAFAVAVAGVGVLLGRPWSAVQPAVFALGLPNAGIFLLILVLTDGLGEELAWRGYALPRLLARGRPVLASLLLGTVWWIWHLPLVWTPTAPLAGMPVWLLLADLVAKSVLFTVVFLHTRGSALMAILLHGTTNLFAVSPPVGPDGDIVVPLVALGLKVALAAVVLVIPGMLSNGTDGGHVDRRAAAGSRRGPKR